MASHVSPGSAKEMAEVLASSAVSGSTIQTGGAFTKNRLGSQILPADTVVSTAKLDRVLLYEPKDLTISVEAGMPWSAFTALLASNGQMVPLDPPFAARATVGGVVASNLSGPRRRWFGGARDVVIGMRYATLDGKLIDSGGMVVKNVAGLDTGKLMIGSYGTLGCLVSVNFKLFPIPPATRTFLFRSPVLKAVIDRRDSILASPLQPWALDLLNPHASALVGEEGWVLAVQAGGSHKLVDRYSTELGGARPLEGAEEERFWNSVREFVPAYLATKPEGCVARMSTVLRGVGGLIDHAPAPVVSRAGNGVTYACFPDAEGARAWMRPAIGHGARGVIEFHGSGGGSPDDLWPSPGGDLEVMKRIKNMLDPKHLLNRGRLHGRI